MRRSGSRSRTSPGVPPERVRVLRRAFDAAMKDPKLLEEAAKMHVAIDPIAARP